MESLPLSQKPKSVLKLYEDVSLYCASLSLDELTRQSFINILAELDKEQSLVIFTQDDVRGTNHGFVKYNCM